MNRQFFSAHLWRLFCLWASNKAAARGIVRYKLFKKMETLDYVAVMIMHMQISAICLE